MEGCRCKRAAILPKPGEIAVLELEIETPEAGSDVTVTPKAVTDAFPSFHGELLNPHRRVEGRIIGDGYFDLEYTAACPELRW
jgi:hypothetical protein